MKKLIKITALFACFCFLFSCKTTSKTKTEQNVEPIVSHNTPEGEGILSKIHSENFTFNNLTFVEGTLDEALQQAKEQDKYLYVVAAMGDFSTWKTAIRFLDYNSQGIEEKIFDKYLFYICSFSNNENKYLFWANNTVASPNSFIFKDSKLVNFSRGGQTLTDGVLLTNSNTINPESTISSRHNLKGQDAIDFINKQLDAYRAYKNFKSSKNELTLAYNAITQTLTMEETYFNNYLALELEKRLGITDSNIAKNMDKYNDPYSLKLFENLK